MSEFGSGPSAGSRDNGLRCGGYVSVGDLDPRVADAMLDTLRAEGIAAYAVPTPAAKGPAMELQLPSRMTDRLYVDATRSERAGELVELEKADAEPAPPSAPSLGSDVDIDAAWQQLLTSLKTPTSSATWPNRENVSDSSRPAHLDDMPLDGPEFDLLSNADQVNLEEEHFVPPLAPPLPKLRRATIGALAAIALGVVLLVTNFGGGDFDWPAIFAIIGGGVALVWNVKSGPPSDSGWDDGAVV
ncbi:MAG TPA: hypothetical protein VHA79_06530 [Mycobacteriales bacterium]|nr:hypothetical protein [Mycobacteriales bacterium]HVX69332.1 hypothetical protein [Mycobacteriales bacterium]